MSHYENICSIEQFSKDTATHEMTVLRDDGVYRHLRFKKPSSSSYYFDLVTWPGLLAITGDMGSNLFCRLDDMFAFFRTDRGHGSGINPGYWNEKLICDGERDGAKEFDEEAFTRVINEYRTEWMRQMKESKSSKEDRRELWQDVEDEVLNAISDYGENATTKAYEFSKKYNGVTYQFDDLFEHSFKKFTFHYIWRCRAIAWGIEQYDKLKASAVPEGEAA